MHSAPIDALNCVQPRAAYEQSLRFTTSSPTPEPIPFVKVLTEELLNTHSRLAADDLATIAAQRRAS